MAGRYYDNSNSRGSNRSWSRSGNRNNGNYNDQDKPPFDLNVWADDMIDIYSLLKSKTEEAGIEIPAEAMARWVTSAKISMDKDKYKD